MITQQQAFDIAKNIIPDIELKGVRISNTISDNKKLSKLPKDCWYVSYSPVPMNHLSCSNSGIVFLCLSKIDGRVLFHQTL
ncbi:MAG: hypothetical protein IPH97_06910 [Ignavibacteriales bacterium]|nr:hypothetical protein [Ignavibacteriales bacterium]